MSAQLIIWILISALPTALTTYLLLKQYKINDQLQRRLEEFKDSSTEFKTPEWAIKQATTVLGSAQKKAEAMITEAEIEGIKIAAGSKMNIQNFEEKLTQSLNEYLKGSEERFEEFLSLIEKQGLKSQQLIETNIQARINQVLLKFEGNLSEFLANSEQKSMEAINLELKSARQLIDSYKTQQLALIDENIVAVLERTLSLVLRNKLTLQDQLDLVFEGLEKAKVEKFFA